LYRNVIQIDDTPEPAPQQSANAVNGSSSAEQTTEPEFPFSQHPVPLTGGPVKFLTSDQRNDISYGNLEARSESMGLALKQSTLKNAGIGLFALKSFDQGEHIAHFKAMHDKEVRLLKQNNAGFQITRLLDYTIVPPLTTYQNIYNIIICNPWELGGGAHYANDPTQNKEKLNAKIIADECTSFDLNDCRYHSIIPASLLATKEIQPGDEIFVSYSEAYTQQENKPIAEIQPRHLRGRKILTASNQGKQSTGRTSRPRQKILDQPPEAPQLHYRPLRL
jgi:hypothetical protein